jgi:putative methionine-R-sulfoxide reductase with GAF domain
MGAVRSVELALEPEQSRLALEGAGIGIWEWTVDTGAVRWSSNVEALFGLPLGELGSTYSEFMQIVHLDDRLALEGKRAAALAGRPGYIQVEYRVNWSNIGGNWVTDRCRLLTAPTRLVGVVWNISDQKAVAVHAMKLDRLWAMTSEIHHMLTRSREPLTVFREACRIAIDKGLFRFAWVGMLDESNEEVIPAASHGYSNGYLDGLSISSRDDRFGRGPTGTAIREDRTVVCNDIEHDEKTLPWRARALERDYRASASFPVRRAGRAVGALSVYAREPQLFDPDTIALMERLAGNISFALEQLDLESARLCADDASRVSAAR